MDTHDKPGINAFNVKYGIAVIIDEEDELLNLALYPSMPVEADLQAMKRELPEEFGTPKEKLDRARFEIFKTDDILAPIDDST